MLTVFIFPQELSIISLSQCERKCSNYKSEPLYPVLRRRRCPGHLGTSIRLSIARSRWWENRGPSYINLQTFDGSCLSSSTSGPHFSILLTNRQYTRTSCFIDTLAFYIWTALNQRAANTRISRLLSSSYRSYIMCPSFTFSPGAIMPRWSLAYFNAPMLCDAHWKSIWMGFINLWSLFGQRFPSSRVTKAINTTGSWSGLSSCPPLEVIHRT